MRIVTILLALALLALLAFLAGCEPNDGVPRERNYYYSYECTVENIQGTFQTYRKHVRSNERLVTMFRNTNGQQRTFMFPAERVQCAEIL